MNRILALIDKYKFGLMATVFVYIAIFIYLQVDSYKQYFPIKRFNKDSYVEIPVDDIELSSENIIIPIDYSGDIKNLVRDQNDVRKKSQDIYSQNRTISDVENEYKLLEEQMYRESGGEKDREKIRNEMNKKNQVVSPFVNDKNKPSNGNDDLLYSGNVMVDWVLTKRTPHQNNDWYVRNPGYTCGHGSSGVVSVIIKVNKNGNVILAEYDSSKSSRANQCMIKQAIKYAKKSRFNYSQSALKNQIGRITYTFKSQ
ncbi:MAG: hypothetical protein CL844_01190 [Crocinitomicaceae bacterium]|nr:hypothetical protein [Crocinitomicaceae bacterium]|tara:strand:- start:3047 stop:3814 length:768 start_codon:yes stop_codon:yes gene_type:complete